MLHCLSSWHRRLRELICLQLFLKTIQISSSFEFCMAILHSSVKFCHSSLHSNWWCVQDSSPIVIQFFLPITVDTKLFSEELKPDPLLGKTAFVLLLPAKVCALKPAQRLAGAVIKLSIRYSSFQIKAPFPFSFPFQSL